MTLAILEFLIGAVLALATLRDVIATVGVPGRTRAPLQIVRRIIVLGLQWWRRARRPEDGVFTAFAPSALVMAFVIWTLLLILAFGAMAHALSASFDPALPSFPQALFASGSAPVTVGLSETDATGGARWVIMAAGFCGLAVMTLAITHLLMIQRSIAAALGALMDAAGGRISDRGSRFARIGDPAAGEGRADRWALVDLVGLAHETDRASHADVTVLLERLTQAGYPIREEPNLEGLIAQRARHAGCVQSLAGRLGSFEAALVSSHA